MKLDKAGQLTRRGALASGVGVLAMPFIARLGFAQDKIPVGVIVGLTGRAGPWGVPVADAIRLVVKQINEAGGIKSKGGAQIELIVADHQSQAQLAGTLTERMTQLQNVVAVIGNATTGATLVGSKAAEAAKTPMLTTDLGESLTEQGLKYLFRIGPRSSSLAAAAVQFARESAKKAGTQPKRIAILADDTAFSQDSANGLLRELKNTDWKVAENVSYPGGGVSDFVPIMQRLKLTGVDLLFQATFAPDGIQIVRAMKAIDYNPIAAVHVAGAPYAPDFQAALKEDAEFITDAVGFVPELVSTNEFLSEIGKVYQKTYNRPIDDQASLAVNCVGVLYDALERAKEVTREGLTAALRETNLAIGAAPYIIRDGVKFDAKGDNSKATTIIMQIRKQQQRIVWPANVATTELVWPMPEWGKRAR